MSNGQPLSAGYQSRECKKSRGRKQDFVLPGTGPRSLSQRAKIPPATQHRPAQLERPQTQSPTRTYTLRHFRNSLHSRRSGNSSPTGNLNGPRSQHGQRSSMINLGMHRAGANLQLTHSFHNVRPTLKKGDGLFGF